MALFAPAHEGYLCAEGTRVRSMATGRGGVAAGDPRSDQSRLRLEFTRIGTRTVHVYPGPAGVFHGRGADHPSKIHSPVVVTGTPSERSVPMAHATGQKGDVVDILTTDHREVDRAFADYENDRLSNDQRRELVDHIITELVRHSVAEEWYLYPAARESLPDGNELADHEIEEHAEVEQLMKRLEGTDVSDPEFDGMVRRLIEDIRHHVQDEERDLFPRLLQGCDADQLLDLGNKIRQAKESAPTRPHPAMPDRPPANTILDPGVGMIDRMRDALSNRRG